MIKIKGIKLYIGNIYKALKMMLKMDLLLLPITIFQKLLNNILLNKLILGLYKVNIIKMQLHFGIGLYTKKV